MNKYKFYHKFKKEFETLNTVCNQKNQIFQMNSADIQSSYNKVKDV
jgi:hypothetical protein